MESPKHSPALASAPVDMVALRIGLKPSFSGPEKGIGSILAQCLVHTATEPRDRGDAVQKCDSLNLREKTKTQTCKSTSLL